MKNKLTLLVAVILALVLFAYMFAYQVRYNEVVVKTTFERVSSVEKDPGLKWKLPWPFQSVHSYSTRVQLLDDAEEELSTADGYTVIVRSYVAWKIEDPEKFFVSLQNTERAEKALQPLLKEMKAIISGYRFDQLVNTDASAVKLAEIEEKAKKQMADRLQQQNYGVVVEHVGIRRVVLPEKVTESVFNRMRATRERLAADARASGMAKAAQIKSEAENAKKTILAFANSRASAIKSEGISKSAEPSKVFEKDPDFAVLLLKLEALKKSLANNATLVLDARGPFDLMAPERNDPGTTAGR